MVLRLCAGVQVLALIVGQDSSRIHPAAGFNRPLAAEQPRSKIADESARSLKAAPQFAQSEQQSVVHGLRNVGVYRTLPR